MVAGQGIKGGPLFDMTKAWFNFLRLLVAAMKRGYVMVPPPSPDSSDPGKDFWFQAYVDLKQEQRL